MPAMPPPTTSTSEFIGTMMGSRGTWKATRLMAARTMCLAFSVASTGSSVTHESCSRMLAIWKRNWLRPPSATALRKVGSCMVGEQAATTTRLMPNCLMSSWMSPLTNGFCKALVAWRW